MWESVPVKLNNAKFIYDVKVNAADTLEQNVSFDYDSVDLVVGENKLYSSSSGSIICANPGTDEQKWSFNLDTGIIRDLPFVFEAEEAYKSGKNPTVRFDNDGLQGNNKLLLHK
ncbi:MAG: hypothetical protein J6P30_05600 [Fibrobacter sp.]|nr:hypothetical protein [Fibrobacter sp.]